MGMIPTIDAYSGVYAVGTYFFYYYIVYIISDVVVAATLHWNVAENVSGRKRNSGCANVRPALLVLTQVTYRAIGHV